MVLGINILLVRNTSTTCRCSGAVNPEERSRKYYSLYVPQALRLRFPSVIVLEPSLHKLSAVPFCCANRVQQANLLN